MTSDQFESLLVLTPGKRGLAAQAAELVLVNGMTISGAAAKVGMTRAGVSRLCHRLRNIAEFGCPLCGLPVPGMHLYYKSGDTDE